MAFGHCGRDSNATRGWLLGTNGRLMAVGRWLRLASCKLRGYGYATEPHCIATALAKAAFYRSQDGSAQTPFSSKANNEGLYHTGGKMDDITVVAAWVVRTS